MTQLPPPSPPPPPPRICSGASSEQKFGEANLGGLGPLLASSGPLPGFSDLFLGLSAVVSASLEKSLQRGVLAKPYSGNSPGILSSINTPFGLLPPPKN